MAKEFKPEILVHLGDLADFWSISRYSKEPSRADNLESEVAAVNELLDRFDALGARKKLIVLGNHEARLEKYLADHAPELASFVDVSSLFRLKERGWSVTPYRDFTKVGKLNITHDIGSSGRNSIFKCLTDFAGPSVTAHTHRLGYFVEGNLKGETIVATQLGWLGDAKQIGYMHKATALRYWSLGFGVGYLDPATRNVHLVPVPIVSYSCVVEGVLHKG